MKSGLSGQLGFKLESTPGTGVTVTKFIPWRKVGVKKKIERIEDPGVIAGRHLLTSDQWAAGRQTIDGPIELSFYNLGLEDLLTVLFGSVAKTGAGPYTRTYTLGSRDAKSLTIQAGKPGTGGTVHPFTWAGCKFPGAEIVIAEGEIATIGLDTVAMSETTGTALATNSITAGTKPLYCNNGACSLSLAGSTVKAKKVTMKVGAGIDVGRRFVGQSTIDEPLEADLDSVTFDVEVEFADLTQYTVFTGATEVELIAVIGDGTTTFTVTANVRYDGEAPDLSGKGLLTQTIPMKLVADDTDALSFTAVLVNATA